MTHVSISPLSNAADPFLYAGQQTGGTVVKMNHDLQTAYPVKAFSRSIQNIGIGSQH